MGSAVISSFILLGLLTCTGSLTYNGDLIKAERIQDFPYFVSIEVNGQYACAATIVDDKYVMTTYSCVQGADVSSLGVRVGTSKQGQRGEYFGVIDVSPWQSNPFGPSPAVDYDIAMVKVAASFFYTPKVMWANPNADGILEYQEGSLVGWANMKDWGGPLISAEAYVMPSSNCSQIYSGVKNISEDMFCLWPLDPNDSLCFADMGAPFYLNEQFYGLVTFNPGCDRPDLPILVTGVSRFTFFIIATFCDLEGIFGDSFTNIDSFAYANTYNQQILSARYSMLDNM